MSRRNKLKIRPLGRAARGLRRAGAPLGYRESVWLMSNHYAASGHMPQIYASVAYFNVLNETQRVEE